MVEVILKRLFRYESIDGHGRCPTYLHRWTLFQPKTPRWLWRGFGVYLHKFVGDDWSRDLHDHPKRFISIGLSGAYREIYLERIVPDVPFAGVPLVKERTRDYVAPWLRTFPADHTHRLELIDGRPCWTLVVVLRSVRPWGFWTKVGAAGWKFTGWRDYVTPGNPDADAAAHCPEA